MACGGGCANGAAPRPARCGGGRARRGVGGAGRGCGAHHFVGRVGGGQAGIGGQDQRQRLLLRKSPKAKKPKHQASPILRPAHQQTQLYRSPPTSTTTHNNGERQPCCPPVPLPPAPLPRPPAPLRVAARTTAPAQRSSAGRADAAVRWRRLRDSRKENTVHATSSRSSHIYSPSVGLASLARAASCLRGSPPPPHAVGSPAASGSWTLAPADLPYGASLPWTLNARVRFHRQRTTDARRAGITHSCRTKAAPGHGRAC